MNQKNSLNIRISAGQLNLILDPFNLLLTIILI
jgi:hypothetical protein